MEFRRLSPNYASSPQIGTEDIAAIKAGGFTTVICNRPDAENPAPLQAAAIGHAVEAAGLRFVANPVVSGQLTADNVAAQQAAIAASEGPVFAYCASGNRSSIVWALAQDGRQTADALIAAAAAQGYNLDALRPELERLAAARAAG